MKNLFVVLFIGSALAACTRHTENAMIPASSPPPQETQTLNGNENASNNPRVDAGHVDNNGTNVKAADKIFDSGKEGPAPGGSTTPASHPVSTPE